MLRLTLLCLLVAACRAGAPAADKPVAPPEAPAKPEAAIEPVVEEKPAAAEPVVAAQPAAEPVDDGGCKVEAFVIDDNPGGLPLREAPSEDADIAGGIWAYEDGTILEIVRGRDGWVEVQRARQVDGSDYNVEGWLSGQKVGTEVRCPDENPGPDCAFALRASPDLGATEGRRVSAGDRVKVIGCRGEWVLAETTEEAPAARAQGWLAPQAQCPNPVTSCP